MKQLTLLFLVLFLIIGCNKPESDSPDPNDTSYPSDPNNTPYVDDGEVEIKNITVENVGGAIKLTCIMNGHGSSVTNIKFAYAPGNSDGSEQVVEASPNIIDGNNEVKITSIAITGITSNRLYNFHIHAKDKYGFIETMNKSFRLPCENHIYYTPTITGFGESGITIGAEYILFNGKINPHGYECSVAFEISKEGSSSYTAFDADPLTVNGVDDVNIFCSVKFSGNFQTNTKYNLRVIATNKYGKFITFDNTFETPSQGPEDLAAKETAMIQDYLKAHSTLTFQVQPSGLYYYEVISGTGNTPKVHEKVNVKYTGKYLNGTVFDSSESFVFPIGEGSVIAGFDEGVSYMKPGGKSIFLIPSKLAYGTEGYYSIPGYTPLLFEVELLMISK